MNPETNRFSEGEIDVIVLPDDEMKLKAMRDKSAELFYKFKATEKQGELEEKLKERYPDKPSRDTSRRNQEQSDREVKLKVLTTLLDSGSVDVKELYPEDDDRIYFARAVLIAIKSWLGGTSKNLHL